MVVSTEDVKADKDGGARGTACTGIFNVRYDDVLEGAHVSLTLINEIGQRRLTLRDLHAVGLELPVCMHVFVSKCEYGDDNTHINLLITTR